MTKTFTFISVTYIEKLAGISKTKTDECKTKIQNVVSNLFRPTNIWREFSASAFRIFCRRKLKILSKPFIRFYQSRESEMPLLVYSTSDIKCFILKSIL